METKKLNMNISAELLKEIEKYQQENYIAHRTTAIVELIRKGLQK